MSCGIDDSLKVAKKQIRKAISIILKVAKKFVFLHIIFK